VKIVIAADHEGFDLKSLLITSFKQKNILFKDMGTYSKDPVDYPNIAEELALAIREKKASRGILICGSGIGISIAANRMPWIRCGICHDTYSAHQGVEHDDMNVLALGSNIVSFKLAEEIIKSFLNAHFTNEMRHLRRLAEIKEIGMYYGIN
jgi:RpiB/LacA/LacB family sugar-phosphate isomerase